MLTGVEKLNKAVSSTLGAKGRHVIIQQGNSYAVTKDGVTVAHNFELSDPVENAAAAIVKDAASRTARDAGDGTTTSTVIAHSAISQAMRLISSGANPMDLKRGMDKAVIDFVKIIDSQAIPIETEDDIFHIATISANNDPNIGRMLSEIFAKVGKSGAVRLEETGMNETVSEIIEGCQISGGMMSPNFITNQTKRVADYVDPVIFLTDKKFENSFSEIIPVLKIAQEFKRPLVIICGGMEGETLGTLVINKVQKQFHVVAITAPDFGENRMEILDDLAAMTGATVISEARGLHIDQMTADQFGRADRVICSDKLTTIIGRSGSQDNIDARVNTIKQQQEDDTQGNQAWRLSKRIASLTSGIGVIYVGGNSDTEMKESYYRLEDALAATRAALDEGYLAGGGIAYKNASVLLNRSKQASGRNDEKDGYGIVLKALISPLNTIVENCGMNGEVVLSKISDIEDIRVEGEGDIGYNALSGEYTNMINAGIIDPVKVIKSAVKNAISVAGMIITTNCTIVNEVKK